MNASKTARLPSLVETISQGFGAVNRRLWVLLIPLLVDLFYWLGPRLSPQPLADRFFAVARALDPQTWDAQRQQFEQLTSSIEPIDLSLLSIIPGKLPKFLNVLTPLIDLPTPPVTPATWHIGSIGTLVLSLLLINALSLIATTLYLAPLAEVVRGTSESRLTVSRLLRILGSFATILLILVAAALLILIPFTIITALIVQLNVVLGEIIFTFGIALIFWMMFTASFSFDAVVVSGVGPLRALLTSLLVVQRSFWGAAGLFVLGWVILWGMSIVWAPLAATIVGLIVAMLGSAYISSGLAAAHLVFYRDRLSRSARRV